MQQFKLSQRAINRIVRRTLVISIPVLLLVAIAALGKSYYEQYEDEYFDPSSIYSTIGIVLAIFLVVILWSIRWARKLYGSYTLTITDNTISREQRNMPTITVYHNEITTIYKGADGSYAITSKDKTNSIIIYPGMEEADNLEIALNNIMPVTPFVPKARTKVLTIAYIVGYIALLGYIFLGQNTTIINICKAIVLCGAFWGGITIIRSKNTDKRMKYIGWFIVVAMALGLLNALIMWLEYGVAPFQK